MEVLLSWRSQFPFSKVAWQDWQAQHSWWAELGKAPRQAAWRTLLSPPVFATGAPGPGSHCCSCRFVCGGDRGCFIVLVEIFLVKN